MIPKLEIVLLAATDKAALFNMHISSFEKEESHTFNVHFSESDEISGKKKLMEFVSEILSEFIEEYKKENLEG